MVTIGNLLVKNMKNNELTSKDDAIGNLVVPMSAITNVLNIHQATLRIYDKEGILSPKRSSKNRREYTVKDVDKLKTILFLTRNIGVNLSGVKIIFAILNKFDISSKSYFSFLSEIAKSLNLDINIQNENIKKYSKRGRKKY